MRKLILLLCLLFPTLLGASNQEAVFITDEYGFKVEATPIDQLRVVIPTRLAGTTFSGDTGSLDPNFWSATTQTGVSTVTVSNNTLVLYSSKTANGSIIITSKRIAQYISTYANMYRGIVLMPDTGVANNIRRWGAFNSTDGCYWMSSGTVLGIGYRRGGVETFISTSAFNGKAWTPSTNFRSYEVYWTNSKLYYASGGQLLHTVTATTQTLIGTTNLPVAVENTDWGVNTSSAYISIATMAITRLGPDATHATYFNGTGAGTYVLKYSPGRINSVIVNGAGGVGSSITVYDSKSGTGNKIATIDTAKISAPTTLDYNVPFNIGLTIVVVGVVDFTVSYE